MSQQRPLGSDPLGHTLPTPRGPKEKFIEKMEPYVAYLDHKLDIVRRAAVGFYLNHVQ